MRTIYGRERKQTSGRSNYVTNDSCGLAQLRLLQLAGSLAGPHCHVCMAVKSDISVLLEAVRAEHYTEKLANNGVVTIEQCATLTEEGLKEWGISSYSGVPEAIRKAKALLSSRDDVVQQELLVSGTSLG